MNNEKFEKLDNEQKELVKYWIEKLAKEAKSSIVTIETRSFTEKYLTPEPVIEVGKWYKHKDGSYPNWLVFNGGEDSLTYGFTATGDWGTDFKVWYIKEWGVEATREEVEQRLIEEAKRRGFVNGAKTTGIDDDSQEIIKGTFFINKLKDGLNAHLKSNGILGVTIFKDGKWAEIIDEKAEIRESVARLEAELKELKSKL